ncbi:MAG: DUF4082 domain-containing protein [Patescibacteria group bacterium]
MKQQLGILVVLLLIAGAFLGYQTISKQVTTISPQTQIAQVSVPSTSGLVGYYNLDEGTGSIANDTSGNNNTGSVNGATWTTGKIAGGLNFNGTSDFISIPDNGSLDITGAGTIATWINLPVISRWNGVFAKGNVNDDGRSYNYAMEVKNDNYVVCVFGNGTISNTVTSTATITANQLTHVACTWDGSSFRLYINGALNTSVSQTITPAINSSPLYLGQYGGNSDRLQGVLDEVRIYNRSLSNSEIQDLYNYTGVVTPPPIPPQIYSFNVSPSSTVSGQAVELAWTTLPVAVSSCTLSGDGPTKSVPISTKYYETQRLTTTTTFTLTCTGVDGTQVSKSVTATVSVNASVISNINTSNITTSSATISWTTDLPADTQVVYGLTSAYGSQTPLNSLLVTSHSQTISGLTANTIYHYKIKSSNGVISQSTDQTFTTISPSVYNVTIFKLGTGTGTVTCNPANCSVTPGSSITLTAIPAASSTFTGWSKAGNCTTNLICTFTPTASIIPVNATFDLISPPPVVGQTLLTTQVPTLLGLSDGAGVNYELGTRFQSDVTGNILAIRFWKDSHETGTHTGRIWNASGVQLASVVFTGETASGWQQQNLATPLAINANTGYMVTVNTGSTYYVVNTTGFATKITSGNLSSIVGGNGRYGPVNAYPTQTYISSNYFRDVVFTPTETPPNYTVTVNKLGTGTGTVTCNPANCSVTPGSSIILTATPASGSTFVIWSNAGSCTTNQSCTFTPTANTTVTATFNSSPFKPTVDISANPTSVTSGGSSNISWTSTNATACDITRAGSPWQTGISGTNVSSGALTADTTFIATCTGAVGTTPASASVTVTVGPVVTGTTYYITQSGAGLMNGSDWTNAYPAIPTTLNRGTSGSTYYVAGGSYPTWTFNTPQSGTNVITMKKASPTDHGTSTGWQASYGTNQAVFATLINVNRGYFVLDGSYRNEGDWFDGNAYGFKIANNGNWGTHMIITNSGTLMPNVTVKYLFIDALIGVPTYGGVRVHGVDTDTYSSARNTGYVFSRMYIKGSSNPYFVRNTVSPIVEYSAGSDTSGSALYHSESVNLFYSDTPGSNAIVRYNHFRDQNTGAQVGGTGVIALAWTQGAQIYGNIFEHYQMGDGAIAAGWENYNIKVHHNTFVNGVGNTPTVHFPVSVGTGNEAYNNLVVNSAVVYNGVGTFGNNGVDTTSVFANYAAGDYRLARATNVVGRSLSSPYNVDRAGNIHGADSVWDIGAYEYTDIIPPPASTGSIMTKLVGTDLTVAMAPAGVVSKIDAGATTAVNPATFPSLTVANHTVSATDAIGYTESYATCTYPEGGTECTVTSLPSYTTVGLTCASSFCSVSVPVTANTVTKTIFKYDAVVANIPPTVSISSPVNGATFTAPASITINATASDSDGTISSVAFYNGATLLGTDTTSPYSYSWTGVGAGTYSLTARATDNSGAVTTSGAVGVTVGSVVTYAITASTGANGSISPTSATVTSGSNQTFTITPNSGYQVAGVLVDGVSVGAVTSYTFSNVTANHTISATFSVIPAGTTFYIRSGATGNGSGSDWTNAYSTLPATATLQRGATYYVADGSYGSYVFDDPESSTQLITIKKATVANHGIATGWDNTYGDGQAVFTALEFTSSNWVFDGQTRNESDWFDKTAYGFSVGSNGDWPSVSIAKYGARTDNVTLKYTYILAIVGNLPGTSVRRMCISTDNNSGETINSTGHVFSRVFCDGGTQHWFVRNSEAPVIEYSASDRITGNSANHGENINLYYNGDNSVIRYNKFRNSFMGQGSTPAGGGTAIMAISWTNGHQIYGNIVYNYQVGNGVIGFGRNDCSNCKIYNNTFANSTYGASGIPLNGGSNNYVYNNLWINTNTPTIAGATHDYNGFSGSASLGEANQQLNIPTSIFNNYTGNDFTLKTNTNPGTLLPAPYNVDMLGRTRTTWSRGAYEYTAPIVQQDINSADNRILAATPFVSASDIPWTWVIIFTVLIILAIFIFLITNKKREGR